jgi:glycosyltransferase involved in cell wall biosynthesis
MRAPQGDVIVCFPFIGDAVGGSHLSALGLIRNIDRTRFKPLVVLHRTEGPLADFLTNEGVAFEKAPVASHLDLAAPRNGIAFARVAGAFLPLIRFLRERRAAIVHTNDGRTHVTWGPAARLAGAKLLWHHRGDPSSFGLRYIAPLVANRLVAVSRFASPRPGWLTAANRCSVVHSPFDVTGLSELDRNTCRARLVAELGCPEETQLIGYVGALVDRKRPLLFVDTIAALTRLAPNQHFAGVIFGEAFDGLDEAVTKRADALGISDHIHLLGFRYPGEPWLAALDLLLVTAVNEPFGRTLIEAMLLGTPVVAAASGGNPEAVRDGETGVLVCPDDADAFAEAALGLLARPERTQTIVEAARREARIRFGIDHHVTAITSIYSQLLGRGADTQSPHLQS